MPAAPIDQTISDALRSSGLGSYARQAQPIVDTLVQREAQIAADLIAFAEQQGLRRSDARAALEATGMTVPTLQPGSLPSLEQANRAAETADSDASVDMMLARINERLGNLEQIAQRHGLL
jgi:hypothetical protein